MGETRKRSATAAPAAQQGNGGPAAPQQAPEGAAGSVGAPQTGLAPLPGGSGAPLVPVPIREPYYVVTGPPSASDFEAMRQMAEAIANTDFVPKDYKQKPMAVLACIMWGREVGIGPMDSLRSIFVINGRPSMAAELQLALIRRAGHLVNGSASREQATITGRRRDTGEEHTVTWTIKDAQETPVTMYIDGTKRTIKLADKDNWQGYPRQMLWARCVSELKTQLFSDVARGLYVMEVARDLPAADASPTSQGTAASTAAPPAPPAQPPMTAEQEEPIRILNRTLPKEKQWTKNKVEQLVANKGFAETLQLMVAEHATSHGDSCPHYSFDARTGELLVHPEETPGQTPPTAAPPPIATPTASGPAPTEDADQEKLL